MTSVLYGDTRSATAMAFGPDSRTLLVGSLSQPLVWWGLDEPTVPVRLATTGPRTFGGPKKISVLTDGHTVAINDGADAEFWDFAGLNGVRADPVKAACDLVVRGLSADEWAQNIPEFAYRETCPR